MPAFFELVDAEVARKRRTKTPISDLHQAYGLLVEEIDEFFAQVKRKTKARDLGNALHELVQVSALCRRTAEDLGLLKYSEQAEDAHDIPIMIDQTPCRAATERITPKELLEMRGLKSDSHCLIRLVGKYWEVLHANEAFEVRCYDRFITQSTGATLGA